MVSGLCWWVRWREERPRWARRVRRIGRTQTKNALLPAGPLSFGKLRKICQLWSLQKTNGLRSHLRYIAAHYLSICKTLTFLTSFLISRLISFLIPFSIFFLISFLISFLGLPLLPSSGPRHSFGTLHRNLSVRIFPLGFLHSDHSRGTTISGSHSWFHTSYSVVFASASFF